MTKLSRVTALVAATAAAGLSGAVIAGAADSSSTSTTPNATTPGKHDGRGHGGPGHGGRGHGGPGHHANLAAIAKALDVTEAKLTSAIDAARPDQPTDADKSKRVDAVAAAIGKSLGESTADVKTVLESLRGDKTSGKRHDGDRRGGRGSGGAGFKGDDTALVAALVKKFSVTTAKAQAAVDAARKAHEAEHTARETALYAAIAKTLGKDAADVKKAFEANRPAKPKAGTTSPTTPAPTTP